MRIRISAALQYLRRLSFRIPLLPTRLRRRQRHLWKILRPARQRMLHRGSQLQEPLKGYRLRTLRSTRLLPHLRRLLEPPLLLMSLLRARQYPSSSNVQVFHPTRSPMVRLRQTYLPNRRFPDNPASSRTSEFEPVLRRPTRRRTFQRSITSISKPRYAFQPPSCCG